MHQDLIANYRSDFANYNDHLPKERLNEVIMAVPENLGQKFVYSRVNPSIKTGTIEQALELLCKATVCHPVQGTEANGVPLAAKIQHKYLKVIYNVGLCSQS